MHANKSSNIESRPKKIKKNVWFLVEKDEKNFGRTFLHGCCCLVGFGGCGSRWDSPNLTLIEN